MTVTEMDTLLAQQLSDADGDIWTQATHRLPALNAAQDELIPHILQHGQKHDHVFDLLSELQEKFDDVSVPSTGFDLATVAGGDRYFLRNGYVLSSVTLNGETRYPVRYSISKIGLTANRFQRGTDRSPKCYIYKNFFYLQVDTGSYPVTTDIYYIGKPYKMATTASNTGDARDQIVATPDYNVIIQNLVIKLAMVKCLFMRADNKDFNRISLLQNEIYTQDIPALVKGAKVEPQSKSAGQFSRDTEKDLKAVLQNIMGGQNA